MKVSIPPLSAIIAVHILHCSLYNQTNASRAHTHNVLSAGSRRSLLAECLDETRQRGRRTHTDVHTNCSVTLSECRTLNTGRSNKRERGEEETVGERGTRQGNKLEKDTEKKTGVRVERLAEDKYRQI